MFPEPNSALPLPRRPSLERYKKIAKELVTACRSGRPDAMHDWAQRWVDGIVASAELSVAPGMPVDVAEWVAGLDGFARRTLSNRAPRGTPCSLTGAQFVIARSHGFASWPAFARHLDALVHGDSSTSRFEAAADAIVAGDLATVEQLLRDDPALIGARSSREHRATLLHYVSANGVEGYRQKTPPNIVAVTEALLAAGAEVDATARVYGAQCTTLELAATSIHPVRAGVLEALLRTLIDDGAAIDGHGDRSIVAACLSNNRLAAAQFLAASGARVGFVEAAGLGRVDVLHAALSGTGEVMPAPATNQRGEALLHACRYGHTTVAELLVGHGADLRTQTRDGQTALHCAVMGAHVDTVRALLRLDAPLDVENAYGGTPLGQARWSAVHGGDPDRYAAIIDALARAVAR
jgi:ankyrin repeat protein